MPFLTYQITPSEAVRNAGRLLKDAGAAAVKVEGGRSVIDVVRRLVDVGIPVMGHLGVLPQSVNQQSGYRQRGRDPREAELIFNDALALQDAGVFAVVLEAIPAELAAKITSTLEVPTVGIGAGPDCDGQVLVSSDLLGLHDKVPPFAKKYANLAEIIVNAARAFVADVQATSSDVSVSRELREPHRSELACSNRLNDRRRCLPRRSRPGDGARADDGRAACRACGADRRRAPRVRRRGRHRSS